MARITFWRSVSFSAWPRSLTSSLLPNPKYFFSLGYPLVISCLGQKSCLYDHVEMLPVAGRIDRHDGDVLLELLVRRTERRALVNHMNKSESDDRPCKLLSLGARSRPIA